MAVQRKPLILKILHPAVRLLYFAGLLTLLFSARHPLYTGIFTAGVLSLAFIYVGVRRTLRQIKWLGVVALGIVLINPLLVHRGRTLLFYCLGNPITLESIVYGAYNGLFIITLIVFFTVFNKALDQAAFLYLTARWMPRTAFILNMSLYAVSRFKRRAAEMWQIQQVRGFNNLREGSIASRARAALLLLNAFTLRNLEEGMETAEVLKAKDYGTVARTHYASYRFAMRDAVWLFLWLGLLGVLMLDLLKGFYVYNFYPAMDSLEPLNILNFGIFFVFIFTPLIHKLYGLVRRKG